LDLGQPDLMANRAVCVELQKSKRLMYEWPRVTAALIGPYDPRYIIMPRPPDYQLK